MHPLGKKAHGASPKATENGSRADITAKQLANVPSGLPAYERVASSYVNPAFAHVPSQLSLGAS